MSRLKVSTRRIKFPAVPAMEAWEGLIRDERRKVVWECGHAHPHRTGSYSSMTAWDCARREMERRQQAEQSADHPTEENNA